MFFLFIYDSGELYRTRTAVALSLVLILRDQCVFGHVVRASFVLDIRHRNALPCTYCSYCSAGFHHLNQATDLATAGSIKNNFCFAADFGEALRFLDRTSWLARQGQEGQ